MTDNNEFAQIGVVGLAVTSSNIACNFTHRGHTVAVYNHSPKRTRTLIAEHGDEGSFVPSETIEEFVASLERPCRTLIMIQAGTVTGVITDQLVDVMEPGDIITDSDNSPYTDTARREKAIRARGLHYVGTGISGGKEGALTGPFTIPGGTGESYESLGPLLESTSAHVDDVPYCTHISSDGAGHFVKMIHNGIEYTNMQVIGRAYHLLREAAGLTPAEIADIFREWNKGDLDSYPVEIIAGILSQVDEKIDKPLVDVIANAVGQRDTGRRVVKAALDLGIPITGIGEAVFARVLSPSPVQRGATRNLLSGNLAKAPEDRDAFMERVRKALHASKIIAYSQSFDEANASAKEYG